MVMKAKSVNKVMCLMVGNLTMKVSIPSIHGQSLNCFGLLSRTNDLIFSTTQKAINADFIIDILEILSLKITKLTVIVLDNAKIHTSRKVKERLKYWQDRGLYIFYLPNLWLYLL